MVMKCKELEIAEPTAVATGSYQCNRASVCAWACVFVIGGLGAQICSCKSPLLLSCACYVNACDTDKTETIEKGAVVVWRINPLLASHLNRNLHTNVPHVEEPLIREVIWKLTFSPIQTSSPTAASSAAKCSGETVICGGTAWLTPRGRTSREAQDLSRAAAAPLPRHLSTPPTPGSHPQPFTDPSSSLAAAHLQLQGVYFWGLRTVVGHTRTSLHKEHMLVSCRYSQLILELCT